MYICGSFCIFFLIIIYEYEDEEEEETNDQGRKVKIPDEFVHEC